MGIFSRESRCLVERGFSKMGLVLVLFSLSFFLLVGVRMAQLISLDVSQEGSIFEKMLGREAEKPPQLPLLTTPEDHSFTWKYQGKTYVLHTVLYASLYEFYAALPTGVPLAKTTEAKDTVWWTKLNALFLQPTPGDTTIADLARALRALGEENDLNENELVELVAAFVQSLPYDQAKTDRRESGLGGLAEKTTYPYEVLYTKKGVCQDKSYLAYRLLQELGIGVSLFLFPDPRDNHMAVGVQCPAQYANYHSNYCFLETTSTGNKIGTVPSLSAESRVATAQIQIGDVLHDQSEDEYQALGRVEILNAVSGKEYTGIIETLKTRDEIERLKEAIYASKRELKERERVIANEEKTLDQYEARLAKLQRQEEYEAYNALVGPYNQLIAALEKHIASYNALVEKSNQSILRYNTESRLFYE